MNVFNLFRFLPVVVIFGILHSANAATVSWGALTTSAVTSCDAADNCDINSNADADGGSSNATASTLIDNDVRGFSSAQSILSGTAFTPTLSVYADSFSGPGIDDNLVQSTASGIQAYTSVDNRTITLDLLLSTGNVLGPASSVVANVVVFIPGAPELTFDGDTLEDIALDPVLLTAEGSASLLKTPIFSQTTATLVFDVAAGESFLIWALLAAQTENGGIADASNTLTMRLLDGNLELGPGELAIASQGDGIIPLPASVWLFLTGIGIVAGLSRRSRLWQAKHPAHHRSQECAHGRAPVYS